MHFQYSKLSLKFASLALIIGSLAACQNTNPTPITTATSLPKSKIYQVAVDNYAPFAFKNAQGEIVGFDKDILDEIGKRQGFVVNFTTEQWDGIFKMLDDHRKDIIASGVTISPERQKNMDFSTVYLTDGIVVATNEKQKYKNFADFKTATLAVQSGSTKVADLEKFYGKNSSHIKQFATTTDALAALQNHQVDGVFAGESNLKYAVNAMPAVVKNSISFIPYPQAEINRIGYAIQKNRTDDLLNKLNTGLYQMKQDGTYQKIYAKWFGI